MIKKILLFWFLGTALTFGVELSLVSLPESGNLSIQIEPFEGDLLLISLKGESNFTEVLIVEKKPGQFGNYSLAPFKFSGFRLHKTSKKTLVKGTLKETFEFFKEGESTPIKLVATEFKGKGLKNLFKREQEAIQPKAKLEAQMAKDCGKVIPFEGAYDHKMAKAYLGILDLCLQDEDYRKGIATLKAIKVNKGTNSHFTAKLKNHNLELEFGNAPLNTRYVTKYWLENNL